MPKLSIIPDDLGNALLGQIEMVGQLPCGEAMERRQHDGPVSLKSPAGHNAPRQISFSSQNYDVRTFHKRLVR